MMSMTEEKIKKRGTYKFWNSIATDLKKRGANDIVIRYVLRLMHSELDARSAYKSATNSGYNHISMELVIAELNITTKEKLKEKVV